MAPSASDNILKQYLVAVGFQIDEPGHKKLTENIQGITKGMVGFRDSAVLTGIALSEFVKSAASDLQKLYFASQLTGSSAKELTAWGLAAQAAGVGADAAAQAAKNLGSYERSLGGRTLMTMLLGRGVITGDAVKDLHALLDRLQAFGPPGSAGYQVATNLFQQATGLGPDDYYLLQKNRPAERAQDAALAESRRREGFTDKTYQDTLDAGNKFEKNLALIKADYSDLKVVLESKLLPLTPGLLKFMEDFTVWVNKADAGSGAWAAELTAVAASLGLIGSSKIALGFLGRSLGLGLSGGVAAEGAAGAGGILGMSVGEGSLALVGALTGLLVPLAALTVAVTAANYILNQKFRDDWNKNIGGAGATAAEAVSVALTGKRKAADAIGNFFIGDQGGGIAGSGWLGKGSTIADSLRKLVSDSEGFGHHGHAYWDVDHYSIGYGTRANSPNEVITEPEAARRRDAAIASSQDWVMRLIAAPMTQGMLNGLTDLAYNIGASKFAKSARILNDARAGNTLAVANDMLDFDKVRRNGVLVRDAGLHARREEDRALVLSGGSVHQEAHITVNGVNNPTEMAHVVKDAAVDGFMTLLRNNNNLGAVAR